MTCFEYPRRVKTKKTHPNWGGNQGGVSLLDREKRQGVVGVKREGGPLEQGPEITKKKKVLSKQQKRGGERKLEYRTSFGASAGGQRGK